MLAKMIYRKNLLTKLLTYLFIYLLTYLFSYLLTPWSRVLLEKLTGSQLVKIFPHFVEPEDSLPHAQEPATCPCHKELTNTNSKKRRK